MVLKEQVYIKIEEKTPIFHRTPDKRGKGLSCSKNLIPARGILQLIIKYTKCGREGMLC